MTRLKFSLSMSLDGFIAGPDQSRENPLGEGGMALHEWAFARAGSADESRRSSTPISGARTPAPSSWAATCSARSAATGATRVERLVGRRSAVPHPVFVLTHHAREPLEMEGGTTFHFVTDGIEAALERATDAAAGRDVLLGGGASTASQYLRAGLVDEMAVHVTPVLLGRGERLFADIGDALDGYECVELVSSPAVAHFTYARKHG